MQWDMFVADWLLIGMKNKELEMADFFFKGIRCCLDAVNI